MKQGLTCVQWIAPRPDGYLKGFCISRAGSGDVTTLHGDMAGSFRLRLGDYRVLFTLERNTMRIFGVRHRSEAYR
jgi:hypothetical protein